MSALPGLMADLEQELDFIPALTARRITSQRVSWSVALALGLLDR